MRLLVGICTCNRADMLRSLLKHLRGMQLGPLSPDQVGILVIDNRPSGEVAALCREIAASMPVALECVEEPQKGISFARNRAAIEALERGAEYLCFIDDDDRPEPDWLLGLLERQGMTGVDIVVGNRVYVQAEDNFENALADRPDPRTRNDTEIWKKNGLPNLLTACNVLIRRSLIEKMARRGPIFDPVFGLMGGEDADFFMRARDAGAHIARAEQSLVKVRVWTERATTAGVMRRKFRSGCSEGHLVRRYMSASQQLRWFADTLWRLVRSAGALLAGLFSPAKRSKAISKIAWCGGAAFGYAGGSYNYYGDAASLQPVAVSSLAARTP